MVKIEVEVKDGDNNSCQVTVKKPKTTKTSSVTEVKTANMVKMTIDKAMENLSQGKD